MIKRKKVELQDKFDRSGTVTTFDQFAAREKQTPPQLEEFNEKQVECNGRILSVLLIYEGASNDANLDILTSNREKIVSVQGDKSGVVYPRHIPSTPMQTSMQTEIPETYFEDRFLTVKFWNAGKGAKITVEVLYDGK